MTAIATIGNTFFLRGNMKSWKPGYTKASSFLLVSLSSITLYAVFLDLASFTSALLLPGKERSLLTNNIFFIYLLFYKGAFYFSFSSKSKESRAFIKGL